MCTSCFCFLFLVTLLFLETKSQGDPTLKSSSEGQLPIPLFSKDVQRYMGHIYLIITPASITANRVNIMLSHVRGTGTLYEQTFLYYIAHFLRGTEASLETIFGQISKQTFTMVDSANRFPRRLRTWPTFFRFCLNRTATLQQHQLELVIVIAVSPPRPHLLPPSYAYPVWGFFLIVLQLSVLRVQELNGATGGCMRRKLRARTPAGARQPLSHDSRG